MGSGSKSKRKHLDESSDASSPSSSSEESSDYSRRSSKSKRRSHRRSDGGSRRDRERREKDDGRRKHRERKRKKSKKSKRDYESDSGASSSEQEERRIQPQIAVQELLKEFPAAIDNLRQILQMIDSGQAVDIKGISEKSLVKHLKKLFHALRLKENGDKVFSLPPKARPTLEVVGTLLQSSVDLETEQLDQPAVPDDSNPASNGEHGRDTIDNNVKHVDDDSVGPRRRVIGPAMPSAELLAAAAKLTEAQADLRDAEVDEDDGLFVGPPPPAMVAEAASANEAERFEEVTRIMDLVDESPYDILGVNQNRTAENIKKRYWKISLLVHPDKCSHPQANQAFIKLNKAFKEMQDPEKKKALDEKLKQKEEMEKFKIELRAMREAAQWRRTQGLSMEGDDELLAEEVSTAPREREEWMTTLPPERRHDVQPTQSTRAFSKGTKEGRGDTSAWTDTPMDRAQKAKTNYLEAYNEAAALASMEVERSVEAELVDKYNKQNRSKSLLQKHQEKKSTSGSKKKKGKAEKAEKEDWVGNHPWKPWDREKDLAAGRKTVNLDKQNMSKGLDSRFSGGSFQRNFL